MALCWLGLLLTLAFSAAPSAFAVLPHDQAGRFVSRVFKQEAHASLAFGAFLLIALRGKVEGAKVDAETILVFATVFCTVAGYFALQPILAQAKAGQTAWPFAAWHGVSMGFFAAKALLVGALGWRLSAHRP